MVPSFRYRLELAGAPEDEVPRPRPRPDPLRRRRPRLRQLSAARSSSSSAARTAATAARAATSVAEAVEGLNTLIDYRYQQHFFAKNGQPGCGSQRTGKSADDIVLRVPVGTEILEEDGETLVADLTRPGQRVTARPRRQRRLGQPALQVLDQPGAAQRQSRPGGRRAHALAAAEADRRRRPGRAAERRQVDLPRAPPRTPGRRSPTIPSPRCIPGSASSASTARSSCWPTSPA